MSLLDQYNESNQTNFLYRVTMAMCAAAIAVQSETPNTFVAIDAAAAATSITVLNGASYSTGQLVAFGVGLATYETRKVSAIAGNVLTVTATTNAHKAGELSEQVIYNHANRIALAKLILNSPAAYAPLFAAAICANDSTLTLQNDASITDATINNDVSAVYNSIAGTL